MTLSYQSEQQSSQSNIFGDFQNQYISKTACKLKLQYNIKNEVLQHNPIQPQSYNIKKQKNSVIRTTAMKSQKQKIIDKPLRLPQINSKTSTSFQSQMLPSSSNSRVRPSSSSKLSDLQKNLFTQLSQYDDIGKKTNHIKKSKTKKQIQQISSKQIKDQWLDLQAPYLKKLQKMMPQTYMKLIQSKKPEPLQQANNKIKQKKQTSVQLQQRAHIQTQGQSQAEQKYEKSQKPHKGSLSTSFSQGHSKPPVVQAGKQQKRQSSFTVAQRQVQAIFQQYLEQQGMAGQFNQLTEIKSQDLKQLNEQINKTEVQLNSCRKALYGMIQQIGGYSVNIQ